MYFALFKNNFLYYAKTPVAKETLSSSVSIDTDVYRCWLLSSFFLSVRLFFFASKTNSVESMAIGDHSLRMTYTEYRIQNTEILLSMNNIEIYSVRV